MPTLPMLAPLMPAAPLISDAPPGHAAAPAAPQASAHASSSASTSVQGPGTDAGAFASKLAQAQSQAQPAQAEAPGPTQASRPPEDTAADDQDDTDDKGDEHASGSLPNLPTLPAWLLATAADAPGADGLKGGAPPGTAPGAGAATPATPATPPANTLTAQAEAANTIHAPSQAQAPAGSAALAPSRTPPSALASAFGPVAEGAGSEAVAGAALEAQALSADTTASGNASANASTNPSGTAAVSALASASSAASPGGSTAPNALHTLLAATATPGLVAPEPPRPLVPLPDAAAQPTASAFAPADMPPGAASAEAPGALRMWATQGMHGAHTATLRMHDLQMPPTDIALQLRGQEVRVAFVTTQTELRERLTQRLGELQQRIEASGLTLAAVTVAADTPVRAIESLSASQLNGQPAPSNGSGSFAEQGHARGQGAADAQGTDGEGSRHGRRDADGPAAHDRNAAAGDRPGASLPGPLSRAPRTRVDLFA